MRYGEYEPRCIEELEENSYNLCESLEPNEEECEQLNEMKEREQRIKDWEKSKKRGGI